jgi:hypothetical protein
MANELLKNANGDAVPQKLADGATLSASDLNGDDSVWAIFDDPAQGGGSTLDDIVSQLQNGAFEIGTISDPVVLEADDGGGTFGEIYRTNNALHAYLDGQASNISVDLETDNAGIATESTLSNIASALASNGGDTLQVEQQTPVQLEDSGGTNIDPATSTDVGNVKSAIGDETTASQSADSSVSATVIERLSAFVDALNSGLADDEIRVDLVSDSLSGDVDVNLNNQSSSVETDTASAEAFENSTSLSSGGTLSAPLSQTGARKLSGIVTRSTTSYGVQINWLDSVGGNVIQTESIASDVAAGTQTAFDVPARSPYAEVEVVDAGSGSGAVNASYHLR